MRLGIEFLALRGKGRRKREGYAYCSGKCNRIFLTVAFFLTGGEGVCEPLQV